MKLKVDNLRVRYDSLLALDDVSHTFDPGVTAILGPNGAGKSSFLRVLATIQHADSGVVSDGTTSWLDRSEVPTVRERLGYLPQDPGVYPHLTPVQFLNYLCLLKRIRRRADRRAAVQSVLEMVGLTGQQGQKAARLSGGMRQRLALAGALLGDPDVVILDEPTVGLDPEQRALFREVIAQVGQERIVILSTHQTEDVSALCNRVLVLASGRLIFSGSPGDLQKAAQGNVWLGASREPGAIAGWATGTGLYRHVGDPPADAECAQATMEDGYLLIMARRADGGTP